MRLDDLYFFTEKIVKYANNICYDTLMEWKLIVGIKKILLHIYNVLKVPDSEYQHGRIIWLIADLKSFTIPSIKEIAKFLLSTNNRYFRHFFSVRIFFSFEKKVVVWKTMSSHRFFSFAHLLHRRFTPYFYIILILHV